MEHKLKFKDRGELTLIDRLLTMFEENYRIVGTESIEISLNEYGDAQKPSYELHMEPGEDGEIMQVCENVDSTGKLVVSTPNRVVLQIDKYKFSVNYKPGK